MGSLQVSVKVAFCNTLSSCGYLYPSKVDGSSDICTEIIKNRVDGFFFLTLEEKIIKFKLKLKIFD